MKRLTERIYGGYTISVNGKIYYDEVADIAERLAEYEDAEEAGTLVKLPCKVGDKVYLVIADEIFEWEVKSIEIFDFDTVLRLGHKGSCDYAAEFISSLNDRFFLTYEAAEKRLAELKGETE